MGLHVRKLFCVTRVYSIHNQLKSSTLIVSLQTFLSSLKCDKNNFEQHAEFSLSSMAFLAVPCKCQRKEDS